MPTSPVPARARRGVPVPRPGAALAATLAATLAVGLAACGGGEGPGGGPGEPPRPEAGTWTVLQYSMADTDLEPFMVEDVNELASVEVGDQLHVRAFVDRSPTYGDDQLLDQGSWVGGKVLDIGPDGTAEVAQDLGDVNAADPEVLADFLASGIEDHPADHYALIISDHGASWPGMGPDEGSGGDVLDLAEMTDAIASGLDRAGVDRLDLLGFDACLMSSYEVASAMAPLAERMLASQELEPGHGWDYSALQVLAEEPTTTADQLGTRLMEGFAAQAEALGTQDSITLALLDLTRMEEVDRAVEDFAGALSDSSATVAPAVGRANATTLGFARDPDPQSDAHLRDLGMLAETIGEESPEVEQQAEALTEAIEGVVVDRVAGQATSAATGLSIYLPPTADLTQAAYGEVASAEAWGDFLDAFHTTGESIPEEQLPAFESPDGSAQVTFDDDGSVTLDGVYNQAAAENLSEATISYALVEQDGSLTYFGEEVADLATDGSPTASGNYDLTALQLSDGTDSAYAYVDLTLSEDLTTAFFNVPMTYYLAADRQGRAPQEALLAFVLDIEAGEFTSTTLYGYDEASGTYGELSPAPKDIVVPTVLVVSPDGGSSWEPTSDVGLYADVEALSLEFVPVDAGSTLQVDLNVYDFAGNYSTVSALVEAP